MPSKGINPAYQRKSATPSSGNARSRQSNPVGDLLAHQGLITVESYSSSGYVSALLSDGAGLKVAVTGDRSSVRLVLSAALHQLGPEVEPEGGE